ncbi:FtsQ-type POTRA domain-containing protein [Candidatus Daviesbacteria bacterium]|nr:FtsQ-type POTRA domain-containing protein [Candidatus Daviesbacteria bacterium]
MWRRKKFKKRRFGKWSKIYWVTPILLILICSFLFLKSGIFTIKQVDIQIGKLKCIDEKQIKDSANLLGQNFFLLDPAKVEDDLKKKFFCIKSAPLSKIFPNKVKIQTFDREPAALLISLEEKEASMSSLVADIATPSAQQVRDSYSVDAEGVIFSEDTKDLNVPKIYIYDSGITLGKKLENDLIGNSLKILEKVKTLGIEVKEGWIFDNFFIINSEVSNLKIIFRLNEKLDIQLASLQLILDKAKINRRTIPTEVGRDLKELEFIDLRFDKPVVKFAPKK